MQSESSYKEFAFAAIGFVVCIAIVLIDKFLL